MWGMALVEFLKVFGFEDVSQCWHIHPVDDVAPVHKKVSITDIVCRCSSLSTGWIATFPEKGWMNSGNRGTPFSYTPWCFAAYLLVDFLNIGISDMNFPGCLSPRWLMMCFTAFCHSSCLRRKPGECGVGIQEGGGIMWMPVVSLNVTMAYTGLSHHHYPWVKDSLNLPSEFRWPIKAHPRLKRDKKGITAHHMYFLGSWKHSVLLLKWKVKTFELDFFVAYCIS